MQGSEIIGDDAAGWIFTDPATTLAKFALFPLTYII